jgi:fibro-slime domain-containing protein
LWIVSPAEIYGADPGKSGSCTYLMAATVHDMAKSHPDYGPGGGSLKTGMVEGSLGADHKPVPTAATLNTNPNFNTWFNSDPAKPMPLKGAETCVDLEMGKSDDGLWVYDSYNAPIHGYFPIDDFNTLDQNSGPSCYKNPTTGQYTTLPASDLHNFGFCMESHANFVYKKGQVFEFRGDDDVWVFINNKLALDLGGVHEALPGSVNLDTLGLTEGTTYPWDFFFCERKECSSSLRIKTTIYFKQRRALEHEEQKLPDGGTRYRVIKYIGGSGACGSAGDSLTAVPPGPLTFVLYQVGGDSIQTLPKATTSFGGIQIGDSTVAVDTAKLAGLAPGDYRIVFYETANPKVKDEVRFSVTARAAVKYDPPAAQTAVLGNPVRVVAANRFLGGGKDSLVAGTVPWTPSFPAGVSVYADSARSLGVQSGKPLTTAATGLDTLWVYGDPAAQADQTYTFSIAGSTSKVTVTFTLPPLDLPKAVSAAVYDDDGDGRADRLEAVYDRDVSASPPAAVAWRWPASAAPAAGADPAAHLKDGKTLVYSGTPLSPGILTSGQGVFLSTYKARAGKDSVQSLPLDDRIGPVLTEASMHLGQALDTLRLGFSEPLSAASRAAAPADLFAYKLGGSDAAQAIPPRDAFWEADGTAVSLTFPSNSIPEPKAGDLVRLNDGPNLASDALGNRPGTQSRFRVITGDRRTGIQTVTYRKIDPDLGLLAGAVFQPSLESSAATVEQVAEKTGRMGWLLEADLADYAAGDGFTVPDPGQVALEYDAALFTNLGLPVASEKRTLSCTDPVFGGDCRSHRGRVFIGWNYATATHVKVGTGAYVAKFAYRVKVSGKVVTPGELVQTWGLLRRR